MINYMSILTQNFQVRIDDECEAKKGSKLIIIYWDSHLHFIMMGLWIMNLILFFNIFIPLT